MSRDGSIRLWFGGEERNFRLAIGQHRAIQESLDVGVSWLVERFQPYVLAQRAGLHLFQIIEARLLGDLRPQWMREVIYHGLIGGGMTPNEAGQLVMTYVLERPVLECVAVAYAIGLAALTGPEDEDASGEPEAAAPHSPSPEANSGSVATDSTTTRAARGARSKRSTA